MSQAIRRLIDAKLTTDPHAALIHGLRYFITFTANPDWPEFADLTELGYATRQTVVARVFRRKMDQLMEIIQKWCVRPLSTLHPCTCLVAVACC